VRIPALALKRRQWEPYAFATPALILIAIVIVFPIIGTIAYFTLRKPTEHEVRAAQAAAAERRR